MEKAVRRVRLINPRNLGQALGQLVAPVGYMRPAPVASRGDPGCGFVIDTDLPAAEELLL